MVRRSLVAVASVFAIVLMVACDGGWGASVYALEIETCGIAASVQRGTTHVESIGLTSTGTDAISVQAVAADEDWVSVSPSTIASLAPGDRADLIVTLDASGLEPGLYDAVITVTHAPIVGGASSQGQLRVDLNVTSGEPPQLHPGTVHVTVAGLPVEMEPDLTVTAPGCRTIRLDEGRFLFDAAPGEYRLTVQPLWYGVTEFTAEPATIVATLEPGELTLTLRAQYAPDRAAIRAAVSRLNEYRVAANLAPVVGEPDDSLPQWLHTRYAAINRTTGHYENPDLPWSTPEGQAAAASSNIAYGNVFREDGRAATDGGMWIDVWAQAPYHMFRLLDPRTTSVRFAWYAAGSADDPRSVGAIQAIRTGDWGDAVVTFPAAGATAHIAVFHGEIPNPLANCPGYASPTGLPIFFMTGPDGPTGAPRITSTTLTRNDAPVVHCAYDGHTDQNGAASAAFLNFGAAVVIPREPLVPDSVYQVRFVTEQGVIEWSFETASVLIQNLSASTE